MKKFGWGHLCAKSLSHQTLCDPSDYSQPGLSPWDSPGKNMGTVAVSSSRGSSQPIVNKNRAEIPNHLILIQKKKKKKSMLLTSGYTAWASKCLGEIKCHSEGGFIILGTFMCICNLS